MAIEAELKKKCARVALGCVAAEVETAETPAGLDEELKLSARRRFWGWRTRRGCWRRGDFGDAGGV